MPRVTFAPNLTRQTTAPESIVTGATVGAALAAVFAQHPTLRGYVLDDQGAVRKHVAVFVDGTCIADRLRLTDSLGENSEIYVVQSLSGG